MTGRELVTRNGTQAVAKVSAANLPPAISNGVVDLLTAFAAGPQQEDADKKRLLRIYGEAIAGLDGAVADYAIRWLKLHNPRNPFRPTPQDVYETAEKVEKEWRKRVLAHFFGAVTWGKPGPYSNMLKEFDWGPPPFDNGCHIPAELVKRFLCQHLDRIAAKDLQALGRESLAGIPVECFAGGQLASVLAAIAEDEQQKAAQQKHDAYLATLNPELRKHRRIVLNQGENHKLSEEDLIGLAQKAVLQTKSEAARRKQDAMDDEKRRLANMQPDVKAALERMQRVRTIKAGQDEWSSALADYLAALQRHGAKPPPHISAGNATRN